MYVIFQLCLIFFDSAQVLSAIGVFYSYMYVYVLSVTLILCVQYTYLDLDTGMNDRHTSIRPSYYVYSSNVIVLGQAPIIGIFSRRCEGRFFVDMAWIG